MMEEDTNGHSHVSAAHRHPEKVPKRIVFTEGTDARILEASARLLAGTWLAPILIGNEAEVKAAAEEVGFNIRGAEIIDPATYPDMDKMVEEMVALRRGKMTADECRAALMKGNYFGTMLVKMGVADCLLGGAPTPPPTRPPRPAAHQDQARE